MTVTVLVTSFVIMELHRRRRSLDLLLERDHQCANVAYWAVGAAKLWPLRLRTTSSDCFQFAQSVLLTVGDIRRGDRREGQAPPVAVVELVIVAAGRPR